MKKMLIAAGVVGAAVAGTILYLRNRNNNYKLDIKGTTPKALKGRNNAIQELA
jgi:hypothetical protein